MKKRSRFLGLSAKSQVDVIKDDITDNVILEPCLIMKIDYVISGDEHLLKVKEFKGAKIVTAKDFLDL